jgi:hypothetical protein
MPSVVAKPPPVTDGVALEEESAGVYIVTVDGQFRGRVRATIVRGLTMWQRSFNNQLFATRKEAVGDLVRHGPTNPEARPR